MTGALIILAALIIIGFILFIADRYGKSNAQQPKQDNAIANMQESGANEGNTSNSSSCCGMHITCDKDSPKSTEPEYYDDEELDIYIGRDQNSYTDNEIEQFRDILLTLLPHDIAGWAHSIQLRGIEMPTEIKDELLMIVSEARKNTTQTKN